MSDWKEVKLGDVLNLRRGHDLPKSKMIAGEVPVAGSNGVIGYHNKSTTKAPGITIGRSGNVGNAFLYKTDFWAHNTTLYIDDFKTNDVVFVYYFLKNIDFKQYNVGSAVPTLNRNHIHPIEVKLPPLPEQKTIASVLSSLDDKIDLLHRQNKTLEAMAETLFREWFVNGSKESWEYSTLAPFVTCINGLSYKSADLNPSDTAMVTLKSFARNGGFRVDGFKEYTGNFKEQHKVNEGDLVVAHTDITQDAALVGNPVLIIGKPEYKQLLFSMDLVKVEIKDDFLSKEFLYFLMRTRLFKQHCVGFANGSTVLHLSKKAIPEFEFFVPPKKLMEEFTIASRGLLNKKVKNIKHIRVLRNIRDTLLPKLMSGEIRFV